MSARRRNLPGPQFNRLYVIPANRKSADTSHNSKNGDDDDGNNSDTEIHDDGSNNVDVCAEGPNFFDFSEFRRALRESAVSSEKLIRLIQTAITNCDSSEMIGKSWNEILESVIEYFFDDPKSNISLIQRLPATFISDRYFQSSFYDTLLHHFARSLYATSSKESNIEIDITEKEEGQNEQLPRAMCLLISEFLVSGWPPKFRGCAKEQNALLYFAHTAVHTWLDTLKKTEATDSSAVDDDNNISLAEVSVYSLRKVCNKSGRRLWQLWPELVETIYDTLKMSIVRSDGVLKEETKLHLLDLLIKINDWTKSRGKVAGSSREIACQTDSNVHGKNFDHRVSSDHSQQQQQQQHIEYVQRNPKSLAIGRGRGRKFQT